MTVEVIEGGLKVALLVSQEGDIVRVVSVCE